MRIMIVLVALVLGWSAPLRAGDEIAAAQTVITSQIDAIRRNDASTAYSFASPTIQDMFPTPEIFMGMVRQGYAPLVQPKRFELGKSMTTPEGKIAQRAHIVDSDGVGWEAMYTLEQQPDGSLKISGCSLLKADEGA